MTEIMDQVLEAMQNILPTAQANGSVLTDRTEMARALNFGKYPVLTYNLDDEKSGSRARVASTNKNYSHMKYNCTLYMGKQKSNDGIFYLMTKNSMLKAKVGVDDYLESAAFANAPIIEAGQEVAILVYSKTMNIQFVIIAKAGKVDPSFSTATTFTY